MVLIQVLNWLKKILNWLEKMVKHKSRKLDEEVDFKEEVDVNEVEFTGSSLDPNRFYR